MDSQTPPPTPTPPNRLTTLTLHIFILTLDLATLTTLAVSLTLYSAWIPATSYPTTALHPITNTDKTDWIVLAAVVISLTWTTFITIRLAFFTRKTLPPALTTAFELVCLVWLIACIIPAFVLRKSSLGSLAAISTTCDDDDEQGNVALTDSSGGGAGAGVKWVCMPHLNTLKKVQVAAYSVACVVALLHLILSALAFISMMQQRSRNHNRTRPSALMAAAPHIEKGTNPDHHIPEILATATDSDGNRRSESASSSSSSPSTQHQQHPRIEVSEF